MSCPVPDAPPPPPVSDSKPTHPPRNRVTSATRPPGATELVRQHPPRHPIQPPQPRVTVGNVIEATPRHQERLRQHNRLPSAHRCGDDNTHTPDGDTGRTSVGTAALIVRRSATSHLARVLHLHKCPDTIIHDTQSHPPEATSPRWSAYEFVRPSVFRDPSPSTHPNEVADTLNRHPGHRASGSRNADPDLTHNLHHQATAARPHHNHEWLACVTRVRPALWLPPTMDRADRRRPHTGPGQPAPP